MNVGRKFTSAVACFFANALIACKGERVQSVLHPASDAAHEVSNLWWYMLGICSLVFLLVIILLAFAIFTGRQDKPRPPLGDLRFVTLAGIVMPTIVLVSILIYSLSSTMALRLDKNPAFTIEVIGYKWWWEVRYPDHGFVTANEIHIPVGQKVQLKLRSADVIHSFWIPELQGKTDLLPEHTTTSWIAARRTGVFRGQCAEYCGGQHALMAMHVVASERDEFEQWIQRQKQPAPSPWDEKAERGKEVFVTQACKACHNIQGAVAEGVAGPDLTHFGSRKMLGSGIAPNTSDVLAKWITDTQKVKPGSKMPNSPMDAGDLDDLVYYLEGLR